MNFISIKQEEGALELKYCERCGGLWIRRQGQDVVYCGGCRGRLEALVSARGRRRFPARDDMQQAQIKCLLGVAAEVQP